MIPIQPLTKTAVTMPAPALSAVVIAVVVVVEAVVSLSPAVGLLVLFPPVVEVTGAVLLKLIKFAVNIFVALICSSIPIHPSHVDLYHRTPQVPLLWPVQDAAAAWPDVWSFARMVSYVDGTSRAVNASQVEVSPLKRISLLLQFSAGSQ